MGYTAQRVTFPFAQALPAAAALWSLAATIHDQVNPARQKAALTAEQLFEGNYANQFRQRMQTSGYNAQVAAYDLQQAAQDIANAWADAQHQQQLYLYYAMVQHKRDSRSFWGEVGDWFSGDHADYGSPPGRPEVPGPPSFAATQVPQASVPGESPPPLA
jgi:hypothetical protein